MAQETGPAIFGEEKLNADAMSIVDQTIVPGEQILALSGFDHESKMAGPVSCAISLLS